MPITTKWFDKFVVSFINDNDDVDDDDDGCSYPILPALSINLEMLWIWNLNCLRNLQLKYIFESSKNKNNYRLYKKSDSISLML